MFLLRVGRRLRLFQPATSAESYVAAGHRWAVALWAAAVPIAAFLAQANYGALLDHPERVLVLLVLLMLLVALLGGGYRLWTRSRSP
ncbi:MAG: hypothetical protein Q8O56_05615 [Solirubrobacteraceae bacterium]|nr:hypothetical protein [Solirubrobacteraceae bacterium]